ncbi:MAG: saccharopine dehydrogenase C-terminal domain-containing protein [Candidatus Neomarinimicrobiota bacterium]|nr:saccharopine dehydrogenase C-terminal domain-containing protein [Candidatus Neomarinimicrobiota bacterium]
MANIFQIGSGMVGSAMALDLANNHNVFLSDNNKKSLTKVQSQNHSIKIQQIDVTNKNALSEWIQPADVVLLAVPGFLGYETLKTIIEAGKDVVDISFAPENVLDLSPLAEKNNVISIVDAGVAPGIPNYLLGYWNSRMNIESFEYYVGGLPKNPIPPFYYKAPFSPIDVIEEYTRPARMMINGQLKTKPALSEIETILFEEVGKLEAFNTDGLRSILSTMNHIPNMKEKTLRYPRHAQLMENYRNKGLFDKDNIQETSRQLFEDWKLEKNEAEFTIMDIIIEGTKEKIEYHLYDEFDTTSQISSMARTTGYTATATVNLILERLWIDSGVFPPEIIGEKEQCMHHILNYLEDRNITITKK